MSKGRDPAGDASSDCAVLTPYLIPAALQGKKVLNLGDGFILRAIERRVGSFESAATFSSRVAPSPEARKRLDRARSIVIAGANQLSDDYTVWPGLSEAELRRSKWVFVPFGVGLHGEPQRTKSLGDESVAILRTMHERIEYSSWRCPDTVDYLRAHLPELSDRLLMTGCPVVYDRPLLESDRFHDGEGRIAVTVTERSDFWDRETQTLDFVARRFPRAKRYLVLHQDFHPPRFWEPTRNRLPYVAAFSRNPRSRLRWYAATLGYELVIPESADGLLAFYRDIDLHFGSRLHAHLRFLSQNKRSYLTFVDERVTGMAKFLGFPVCDPGRFEEHLNFDFEPLRQRAQSGFEVMRKFIAQLPARGRH